MPMQADMSGQFFSMINHFLILQKDLPPKYVVLLNKKMIHKRNILAAKVLRSNKFLRFILVDNNVLEG
jgi:hypothetical protein